MSSVLIACAALFSLWSGQARAQGAPDYPSRPIRIVVPFPPGGPTDLYGRIVGQHLQQDWHQPAVVENRPGGTGLIGSNLVRQAAADGYTLLFTSNSAQTISPLLHQPPPFDPVKDFTPITIVLRYPMYLLVNPGVPARTIGDFIGYAKANPGRLHYSSVGIGSGGHLACELFNIGAGTQIVHVPYKGAAPAQTALVSGEVELMCDSVGNSQALVVAGKLRGLAVTAAQRSAAVPEVPTLAEAGVPEVVAHIWLGLLAPPGLERAIRGKLHAEVVRIMNLAEVRERVVKGGSEVVANTPEQFETEMRAESATWLRVIREKHIEAE